MDRRRPQHGTPSRYTIVKTRRQRNSRKHGHTDADREPQFYTDNPFVVLENGQNVGFMGPGADIRHVISSEGFFELAYEVINGGILGWGAHGTYPEVQDAAILLDKALSAE